jgi:hypothetical protein
MKTVKTARGNMLDMGALSTKYERERAVSNVPVNARGDIIDSRGDIRVPKEKIASKYYRDSVPGAETRVSIKSDSSDAAPASKPAQTSVTEVARRRRTRDDGTQYDEIEFSDGSMTVHEAE